MPRSQAATSTNFFAMIPRRSVIAFFAAVFFVFSPIGLLLGSSFVEQRPIRIIVIGALLSGCIAVSWAATFTLSRWWIASVVVFTVLQIAFFGPMQKTAFGIGSAHASVEGVGSVAAIVLGYVLFIVFISGQGRTALRLQTEMALARRIHETLVPRLEVSQPGFDVLACRNRRARWEATWWTPSRTASPPTSSSPTSRATACALES